MRIRGLRVARAAAALGVCLGLAAPAGAQAPDEIVQWSTQVEGGGSLHPGAPASITVAATILPGWHVYALEQLPGGPTPLRVTLGEDAPATLEGAPSASKAEKVHDPRFGLDTQLYTRSLILHVPVRLRQEMAAGPQALAVKVRFQSCTERECRPPRTVQLSVPLEVTHD